MGAKCPPFNVLLMDESPSQEKDQAHTSEWIQTAFALSLPGGAAFQRHAAVPLSPAGISKAASTFWVSPQSHCTFAVPDLQPKPPSSVQKEEMLPAEAAPLSTSLLAQSSFAS